MASKSMILLFMVSIAPGIIFSQVTTSTSTSTPLTTPAWTNPFADTKSGNPGANIRISDKALDAFHVNAADRIAAFIQNMSLANFDVWTGFGTLTIKPPHIADVKLPNTDHHLVPPNRLESLFHGIRLTADGGWQYKSGGWRSKPMSGTYSATVHDGELETTSQFGRTPDAKPMVQTIDCKANFSQFKVDVQGAVNMSVIENCNTPICSKIRSFFEDAICQVLRTFVKEYVNRHLATFPTRMDVTSDQMKINYDVMNGGPKVSSDHINTGLAGKFMWRNMDSVPFNAPDRSWTNKSRMFSFEMTDYTFNTLFHQAHSQGYRFSAADLITKSPDMQHSLILNCTSTSSSSNVRSGGRRKLSRHGPASRQNNPMCLGTLLDNDTNAGPFSSTDTGDLVYKTGQKAPTVYIQSNGHAFVDGGLGNLEIYGPSGNDTLGRRQRPLLARFDVRMIRGEFFPKWNGANITGTLKFNRIQVEKSSPAPPHQRTMSNEWLHKFHHVALPLLTESFNAFLNKYAQFPIPMLASLQCTSPEFFISTRTMQVDCDIVRSGKAVSVLSPGGVTG